MTKHAQVIFRTLVQLFTTIYQQQSLEALMALILGGDASPRPRVPGAVAAEPM